MASDLKASATQEVADSQEVARLIAEGKKVTDPELRRRIPPASVSGNKFSSSTAWWSGPCI